MLVTSFTSELLKRGTYVLGQQDFHPAPTILAISIGCDVREELFESVDRYELAGWFAKAIGSGYSRQVQTHSVETDIVWGQRGFAACTSLSKRKWDTQLPKNFALAPPLKSALRQAAQTVVESVLSSDAFLEEDERMTNSRLLIFAALVPMKGQNPSPFLDRFVAGVRGRFPAFHLRELGQSIAAIQNAPGWGAHGLWGISDAA
ncbi:MAG: hypothetical protein U0136_08775 [Bdellovibrionota bacterium]